MSDAIKTYKINGFIVQENGIVRNSNHKLIGRLEEISELQARVVLLESLLADQVAITGLEPVEASAIASGMRAKPLGEAHK